MDKYCVITVAIDSESPDVERQIDAIKAAAAGAVSFHVEHKSLAFSAAISQNKPAVNVESLRYVQKVLSENRLWRG